MIFPSLRLAFHVYKNEIRKILAYRLEFWSGFLGQTALTVFLSFFLWKSIFKSNQVTSMQGMNLKEFVLYYGVIHLTMKVLLGQGIGFVAREIYYGTLNKYLLYPLSFSFYKVSSYLAYGSFYLLQLLLFVVAHNFFLGNEVTALSFISGISLIITASIVYFYLSIIIESIAFWADNVWSLSVLVRSFLEFGGGYFVPLVFYPENFLTFLSYTPFPYLLYYPAMTVLNLETPSFVIVLFHQVFWGLTFFACYRLMWSRGKYQYSGVGI